MTPYNNGGTNTAPKKVQDDAPPSSLITWSDGDHSWESLKESNGKNTQKNIF